MNGPDQHPSVKCTPSSHQAGYLHLTIRNRKAAVTKLCKWLQAGQQRDEREKNLNPVFGSVDFALEYGASGPSL